MPTVPNEVDGQSAVAVVPVHDRADYVAARAPPGRAASRDGELALQVGVLRAESAELRQALGLEPEAVELAQELALGVHVAVGDVAVEADEDELALAARADLEGGPIGAELVVGPVELALGDNGLGREARVDREDVRREGHTLRRLGRLRFSHQLDELVEQDVALRGGQAVQVLVAEASVAHLLEQLREDAHQHAQRGHKS